MKQLRLSLIDIMAAVAAAGLGLAWVRWVAPGEIGPSLIVVGPLLGILWDRRRGGAGIYGGAAGGLAYAGVVLIDFLYSADPDRPSLATLRDWPYHVLFLTTICVGFGTLMGSAAWLGALAMGQSPAPADLGSSGVLHPSSPTSV